MKFDQELKARLLEAQHIVVFTGAGVSKESGIPTFRDRATGLWEKYDAKALSTAGSFKQNPDLVWGWYEWMRATVMASDPNPAHTVIAKMARHVPRLTVITQNVDDLHERAGSEAVFHLHGSLFRPYCFACKRAHILVPGIPAGVSDKTHIKPPKCAHCGGWIRPGVVWFGENLPAGVWRESADAVANCDVMFSIGTSADVIPAASLPVDAAARGAYVVQVNPMVTPLDDLAQLNLRGNAGVVLPALYEAVWRV
ncbi:MAG: NAD-dependent deacylase [Rhodoferax sp.]